MENESKSRVIAIRKRFYCLLWILYHITFTYGQPLGRPPEPFKCGLQPCDRKGYYTCIGPPSVEAEVDSYCYHCSVFRKTCGKTDEQPGCNLYCTDIAVEETKRRLTVKHTVLEQELTVQQNQERRTYLNQERRTNKYLNASLICNGILVLAVVGLIIGIVVYVKRRGKCSRICGKRCCTTDETTVQSTPLTTHPARKISSDSNYSSAKNSDNKEVDEDADATKTCKCMDTRCGYGYCARLKMIPPTQQDTDVNYALMTERRSDRV